ncbi:MAG: hypothetical protein QXR48_03310 [Candidatus Woesearchaeota archaeon]
MKQKYAVLLLFATLFLAGASAQVLAIYPEGIDNYTIISTQSRTPKTTGVPIVAEAGNITWLAITHLQKTKSWQGFVGNMTGGLVLDDLTNDTLYAWNISNLSGQLYASQNCSIDWTQISIQNDCTVDNALTGHGSDAVSRTYTPSANNISYQVYDLVVNASSVCTAWPYVNDSKQSGTYLFENTILTAGTVPNGNQSIYVANFEYQTNGFDTLLYDFQMLVPVNRSSKFTTYCLYAELE